MSDTVVDFKKERQDKAKAEASENCRMLYAGRGKPMTESLMCFGWECPESWNELLSDLSFKLEELNIRYYPKFRTRLEASQVKEKFGTLRFYYDCRIDPPYFVRCWSEWLDKLSKWLDCDYEFKYKSVEVSPRRKLHSVREMTKDAYEKAEKGSRKCSNVDYQVEGDRYFEIVHDERFAVSKMVPTRRRIRYALMEFARKAAIKLDFSWRWPVSSRQKVVSKVMCMEADMFIREAEDETEHVCCSCGREIGRYENDYACETVGWVSFMCQQCAAKQPGQYRMNGKLYAGGKEVVPKERACAEIAPEANAAAEAETRGEVTNTEPEVGTGMKIREPERGNAGTVRSENEKITIDDVERQWQC